jgi:hypothetical protein
VQAGGVIQTFLCVYIRQDQPRSRGIIFPAEGLLRKPCAGLRSMQFLHITCMRIRQTRKIAANTRHPQRPKLVRLLLLTSGFEIGQNGIEGLRS